MRSGGGIMSVQVNDVGIDFSGAAIAARQAVQDGAKFILRYSAGVGNAKPDFQWKLCKPGEVADAEAVGLDFIANSERAQSSVTEGPGAGAADGAADRTFWKSRGLARGASIYCSWDAPPDPGCFDQVAGYLRAYDEALQGYYHVDLYAGDDALRAMLQRGIIRYGWRPNAGSWSNDPHGQYYQPPNHGLGVANTIRSLSPAHIWQTGNYWYGLDADEDLILRVPVGSHLEAKNGGQPQPMPSPVPHPAPAPHPGPPAHPDVVARPGDTLTGIARRYPEPQITAASIAAANVDRYPSLRTDLNHIEIGWTLRIR
jgi:hypothetical protein